MAYTAEEIVKIDEEAVMLVNQLFYLLHEKSLVVSDRGARMFFMKKVLCCLISSFVKFHCKKGCEKEAFHDLITVSLEEYNGIKIIDLEKEAH